MGQRIFCFIIVLGSILYGTASVHAAVQEWRRLPQAVAAMVAQATPAAQAQARYLQSFWHRGQLCLMLLAGVLFIIGALAWWARKPWGRMTLFGAAWVAFLHLAWIVMTSIEWFRGTGAGMLYQVHVLNVVWVMLVLAVMPSERMVRT